MLSQTWKLEVLLNETNIKGLVGANWNTIPWISPDNERLTYGWNRMQRNLSNSWIFHHTYVEIFMTLQLFQNPSNTKNLPSNQHSEPLPDTALYPLKSERKPHNTAGHVHSHAFKWNASSIASALLGIIPGKNPPASSQGSIAECLGGERDRIELRQVR